MKIHMPGRPGAHLQSISQPFPACYDSNRCECCGMAIGMNDIITAVKYAMNFNVYYFESHLPENLRRARRRQERKSA